MVFENFTLGTIKVVSPYLEINDHSVCENITLDTMKTEFPYLEFKNH